MGNALFDMMDALDALMEARGQRIDVLQTEVCVLRAECRAAADEIVRLRVQQARILAHYRGRLRDEQERRRRELDMCREKLTLRESASTRFGRRGRLSVRYTADAGRAVPRIVGS